ncbi:hypothetical protein CNMCM5793_004683 [Aspergillus hiratsukae]|uniref:chitinase n=1 Tax=Aspergillus hiratsukae TaxID=1194566 RepID=A0A8H6UJ22_9EURO|nr:hypothetical protein CNMCM5793_004683 [Aspergillus hiratsukae]
MLFGSWGGRWLNLLISWFLLPGIIGLCIFGFRTTADSHGLSEQLVDWEGIQELPFHLDSDTWAYQHRNHTFSRRQTVAAPQQTYTCGPGNPCGNGACCGQSGYCGFGDVYCGDGCTSNCNAKAECGQFSETGDALCPLNVCCSEWGFCGTTSDFCGTGCQSNCRTPSSPGSGGDVRNTVIGYFESWVSYNTSRRGNCALSDPTTIPVEALDGVNYAFAYIRPPTYDIVPMPGVPSDAFAKVANIKRANQNAKVWVSIGGWSFSDNETSTQAVFGDISSSLLKRAQFAAKLYQFMVQYGFDGVDIDWEYPGAPDRGGKPEDVGNFPSLLQMIKYKFQVEKKNFGISITAPSSYWYLRWFDLPDIVKYVDYINLMSYDLHGVWDSTDPIGPYVYAHTNLTEVDAALSLLWRNNIDPSKVNLGLAFYGRSFELKDPSCSTPGCPFKGPGVQGSCTKTAGILSYKEIQDIILAAGSENPVIYDPVAGVNYMVYGGTNWISFDDKTTFQQKVDFANARGLNGLFIWAVDLDDTSFTALKSVTGKDLAPTVAQNSTLSHFALDECLYLPCGSDCPVGYMTMTELSRNSNGEACPKDQKRFLCCPPWGAPSPATCSWRGSPKFCYGQCAPGEVLMTTDQCGDSSCCYTGTKAYCCPAFSGEAAVAACDASSGSTCSVDRPQMLGTIGRRGKKAFCCPEEPQFRNCSWYGDSFTCNNNRCPAGQIEVARSSEGDGSFLASCIFGRQKVFCCDPPFDGTPFLPVSLDNLFPETLPATDAPVYYEAFDGTDKTDVNPTYDNTYTDDPNAEPFAWTIMVGAEADVQSLRKRDGSHLETFDCPNPRSDDYSVQSFKAVCTVLGDDNNCEDIKIGSVRGTIIRLPEECGPDEWVRVVSFRELPDHPAPKHLEKRLPVKPKVYEIRYDYNLRNLRRDGGEIYIRLDASVHPGYWDEIVASSPTGAVKRRSPEDWREFHMDWFKHHQLAKRGFGTTDSWWVDRFNALLNRNLDYGLYQTYHFEQILYDAAKSCPPAMASLSATIAGDLSVRLDYGISLIGTLRNFDFSESYAYFNLYKLGVDTMATVQANAAFQYQSTKLQLLDQWDPFGGSYNIKGLWTIGPYFDATAQIQGSAILSGTVSAGMSIMTEERFTYMFPQSLNQFPSEDDVNPYKLQYSVKPSTSANISADGAITLTVIPSIGFQIKLDALGSNLVNTKISAAFSNDLTVRVGASTGSLCNGALYGIDYSLGVDISLENPLPGWASGAQSISVFGKDMELKPMTCMPWSSVSSKRDTTSLEGTNPSRKGLVTRANEVSDSVLFPDILGSALGCPNDKHTPTGNCQGTLTGSDALTKRNEFGPQQGGLNMTQGELHDFAKRDRKRMSFCEAYTPIVAFSLPYPPSGTMIQQAATNPFDTYGPLNPDDCDDYRFGPVATPAQSQSSNFATEHVLEWQLYRDFWQDHTEGVPDLFPDPEGSSDMLSICEYLHFWWYAQTVTFNGHSGRPVDLVATAFPGTANFRNELLLLEKNTNGLKEKIWGDESVRRDTTMMKYLNGERGYDFNDAINVCKWLIWAIDYVVEPAVSQILVTQATRIGQYLFVSSNDFLSLSQFHFSLTMFFDSDDVEAILANLALAGTRPYVPLNLGNKWRDFMFRQWDLQLNKQRALLNDWVPQIESYFQANADGHVSMGGIEVNQEVLNRVSALTEAWQDLPGVIANPFPANWEQ